MTKSRKLNPETSGGYGWNFLGFLGNSKNNNDNYSNTFSPDDFKRTLGIYNPKFRKFESNDFKYLILFLLQTMHEELNYFGNKNQRLEGFPNQYDLFQAYSYFYTNYNTNNFSKISLLFYGTYTNVRKYYIVSKNLSLYLLECIITIERNLI